MGIVENLAGENETCLSCYPVSPAGSVEVILNAKSIHNASVVNLARFIRLLLLMMQKKQRCHYEAAKLSVNKFMCIWYVEKFIFVVKYPNFMSKLLHKGRYFNNQLT